MFSKYLFKIKTKDDIYHLDREIDLLLASLYENGDLGWKSTLESRVRFWVSEIILNEINESKSTPKEYLKSLQVFLDGLESVNLTLGFEPSDRTINNFSSYLRESIGKDVVMDILLDKSILGGVVISYNGKYKDFSIARIINESQSEIEEIVREKMEIKETNISVKQLNS